jgi:hypothetical protein
MMTKNYEEMIDARMEDLERLAALTLHNGNIATMAEMGADGLRAKALQFPEGNGQREMYRLLGAAATIQARNLREEADRNRQCSKVAILNFNLDFPSHRI